MVKKILGITKVLTLIITLTVLFVSPAFAKSSSLGPRQCTPEELCGTSNAEEKAASQAKATFTLSRNNPIESVTVDATFIGAQSDIQIVDTSNINAFVAGAAGRVGIPVDISTSGTIKEATINFNYNSSLLGNTKPENLSIAWYDESRNTIVLLDSKVDVSKNSVSFTTNHFSEYFLIDLAQWYANWRKELVTNSVNTKTLVQQSNNIDIVFLIDDSGSMINSSAINGKGNDNSGLRFTATYNFITQLYDNDGFAVIRFNDSTSSLVDYTLKKDVSNWENLKSKIIGSPYDGTNISGAINQGVSLLTSLSPDRQATMKRMILLTDGMQDGSSFDSSSYEKAKQNNIIIDTIGLSYDGSKEYFDEALLMKIANETGGKYYFTLTQDIMNTFDRIASESYITNNGDTDGDGIPDAVETGGMRNGNGQIIFTDPNNPDTDGDGLKDGEEVGEIIHSTDESQINKLYGITKFVYYDMKSDPTKADTDGDGLRDDIDSRPWFNEAKYDTTTQTPRNTTQKANLIVYAGPGTSYKKIDEITKDKIISFNNYESGWYEVQYANKQGYISNELLNIKLDSSIPVVYNTTRVNTSISLTPRIFNLNIEYKLTSDRDLYYGVSNSSKSFDKITTIPKDTVVLLLHKVTNPEGFSLADYYQIEVSTSAGKIRGYAFEREIMDWYNPLKNFDQVKNNSLAVTYKNNIYYSAFGKYVPNLIGANWHLDSEFTLQKINIDWIAGFKNMIFSNDFNDDAYQKLQKPYLLNVNTKVSSQLGDSVAKQKMDNLANIFSLADAFLAGANKTFSMDIQLQSYQNERKIVILTGNPIEEPLAGKKNVYLSDLILQQRGNGVFFEKENLADEAIRSMFPQLNGTDKYSMIMNFSNDFKDNPYGFEIIIDKNQNVYASPIIHPGTTFNIYYQGKVVLDAAMALGSSYFQPDSSNEILQLLKSNGFSF